MSSVSKSNQNVSVQLSAARANQATKIYQECCKKLAELIKTSPADYGLSDSVTIQDLIALIPDPTFNVKTQKKKKTKKIKLSIENWESVSQKDELKALKSSDLKNILSEKSLPISGNKTTLVDRVWGILHPDQAPVENKKKKRGRPKGKSKKTAKDMESVCTIEDSDDEQVNDSDDIQNLLENRKSVFINKDSKELCDKNTADTEEYQLVDKKNWVFKEDEENFEFVGIMVDNKLSVCDPPNELLEIFAEE